MWLDCGKQFEYDLKEMRMGKLIDRSHDACVVPKPTSLPTTTKDQASKSPHEYPNGLKLKLAPASRTALRAVCVRGRKAHLFVSTL